MHEEDIPTKESELPLHHNMLYYRWLLHTEILWDMRFVQQLIKVQELSPSLGEW